MAGSGRSIPISSTRSVSPPDPEALLVGTDGYANIHRPKERVLLGEFERRSSPRSTSLMSLPPARRHPPESAGTVLQAAEGVTGPPPATTGRVRRAAAWLAAVAADNAEGAVYGVLLIGVLLATENTRHETYGETMAAVAVVVALYWVTRLYTHLLGVRLRTKEPLGPTLIWRSAVHELPVIEGAVTQMIVLVVAWAMGASLTSGVNATIAASAISMVVLEIAAGWRTEPRRAVIWLRVALGVVMGLAVVAVKLVLHA
jgi:hypothetical protein